jgi:hypothetical protein
MQKEGFLVPLNEQQLASAIQRHQVNPAGVNVPVWQHVVMQGGSSKAGSGLFKYQVMPMVVTSCRLIQRVHSQPMCCTTSVTQGLQDRSYWRYLTWGIVSLNHLC